MSKLRAHQHILRAGLHPLLHGKARHLRTGGICRRALKKLPAKLSGCSDRPAVQGTWHYRASNNFHCCHLTALATLCQGGERGLVLLLRDADHHLKDGACPRILASAALLVALAGQDLCGRIGGARTTTCRRWEDR